MALVVGLAACGNTSTAGPLGTPQAIISSAPDITLGAVTAKILITSPNAQANGVIDLGVHSGQLSVAATDSTTGAAPATVLIVNGTAYIKASPNAAYMAMPGPLPLASLTFSNQTLSLINKVNSQDGSDQVLPNADPWADIDLLPGTVHILSDGGAEVDGASTISYTLTINPEQAIQAAPAGRQAALRALLGGRTKDFMIGVWIDSQFRIRRIEVSANFVAPDFKTESPPTRDDGETIGSDVDFVSFGVAVPPVTVPQT